MSDTIENDNQKVKFHSVETQTDSDELAFEISEFIINDENAFFKHLTFANQTYWQHFGDSISYCGKSLQASFYFLLHAIWPDIYQKTGSNTINELNMTIKEKYNKRIREIKMNILKNPI